MATRYLHFKRNGQNILVHRYVMECHLGRPLTDDEVVHHKNGDPHDNRIENLEVMTYQQHAEHHNQRHPVTRACDVCGAIYTPHPTKRARSKTCSRPCMKVLMSEKARASAKDPVAQERRLLAARRPDRVEFARTLVKRTRWKDVPSRPEQVLCACGCGTSLRVSPTPRRQARWVLGHHLRKPH